MTKAREFTSWALRALDLSVDSDIDAARVVPRHGPLIVAANHPHGIIDGVALAELVGRVRPDVRVLANHLLQCIPGSGSLCLFVNPFTAGRRARRRNAGALRAARRWLADGHALIVFPSGEVAHRETPDGIAESAWSRTVGHLTAATGATVLPVRIEGANSRWFYRAGRLHPLLRTMLLPAEAAAQRGTAVRVHLGGPISCANPVQPAPASLEITQIIRQAVDHAGRMPQEIASLRANHLLIRSGELEVFCAPASLIPATLHEIGRLREITFRAVGEGTGQPIDRDRFDDDYLHLFVWNTTRHEVVGAYRIGLTDRILASRGIDGLYTATLFRYDARLLARLSPAVELGRSFVRAEYQRSSNALLLLWKGVAQFVLRHGYRVLFGPVSISSRYTDTSQQLLRVFLTQNFYDRDLGAMVTAVTPPPSRIPAGVNPTVTSDLAELDDVITRLEPDGKGLPVLVRQYLRLNAKLLGFNVDPAFGDALDALMMVDLAAVNPAILRRYAGETIALLSPMSGTRARKQGAPAPASPLAAAS